MAFHQIKNAPVYCLAGIIKTTLQDVNVLVSRTYSSVRCHPIALRD